MGRYLSPMSDETSRPVRPGELHSSPAPQFWPDQSPSLNAPDNLMGCGTVVLMRAQRSPGWGKLSVFGGIGSTAGVGVGCPPWDELDHFSPAPVNLKFVLNDNWQVAALSIRQRRSGILLAVVTTTRNRSHAFPTWPTR